MVTTFQKAKPMASCFKAALYGPPGSGKTFTALLWAEGLAARRGKRVAVVDTETGTRWYAREVKDRGVHPAAFDFDVLHTRSVAETLDAVEGIDTDVYGVVIVDSMSHLWDAAMEAVKERTSAGTIKMQDWGKVKRPVKRLVDLLISLPIDVLILGRQKNVFEDNADGEMKKVGVTMRAEGETPYEPDFCLRLQAEQDRRDPTKTTYMAWVEKDRSGVLAGKVLANASYDSIHPVVALLSDGHDAISGNGEALERDAAMVAEQDAEAEEKKRQKAEKSSALFTQYQAELAGATEIAGLKAIADTLKKNRRYMLDEHRASLLLTYEEKRKSLVSAAVPEGF